MCLVAEPEPAQVMEVAQLFGGVRVRAQGDLHAVAAQELRRSRPELHIAAEQQIHEAIAVRIEKAGAGSPGIRPNAALSGHVDKAPAGLVPEQRLMAVAGDQQVRPAIVVHVGHGTPMPAAGQTVQLGLLAHVLEPLPPVISEQRAALRPHQDHIRPAISVIVDEPGARAADLQDIHGRLLRRLPPVSEAHRRRDVREPYIGPLRDCGGGRSRAVAGS